MKQKLFIPQQLLLLAVLNLYVATASEHRTALPAMTKSSSPNAAKGPRVIFAKDRFDFGRVTAGDVVRHDFVFTNAGDRPLEISRVVPACGCTTVTAPEQVVAPGHRGVIPVEFDSRGMNGAIQRSIYVFANDPARSNVVLKIKADVWTAVEVLPSIACFYYDPDAPKSETRVLRIVNHCEEPVEVSVDHWTNRSFQVVLEPVQAGREFALKITSVPPLGPGTATLPLLLKTSAAQVPWLKAYVCAVERPPILVSPGQLHIPDGPVQAREKRAVMVRNTGPNPLSLSDLELNLSGVECRLQEIQPGRLFSIVVTFPKGFEALGGASAELRVRTNHPRYPVLRIPLASAEQSQPGRAASRESAQSVAVTLQANE